MGFRLGNPPVVEAWIKANMDPTAQSDWDWDAAATVLRACGQNYSEIEMLPRHTPQARKLRKRKQFEITIRTEPQYLRVRSDDKTRFVQIGRNQLLVSICKSEGDAQPRYHDLMEEFFRVYGAYLESIPIASVQSLELHYVDLVVIGGVSQLNLTELFLGAPSLPTDPFGVITDASWSLTFNDPKNDMATANLSVRTSPRDGDNARFRLDWHYLCSDVATTDTEGLREKLDRAHQYVLDCFNAYFHDRVWQTFSPQE